MKIMKRLAAICLISSLAACENSRDTKGGDKAGSELVAEAQKIESRLKALELAMSPGATNSANDPFSVRLARIEMSLMRRQESLDFLDAAYQQQKQAQEQKEASEMDPNGVFAVDVSKALAAGQVEGPNSAIVTIVEAWDFA
jgi:hypothetical protein